MVWGGLIEPPLFERGILFPMGRESFETIGVLTQQDEGL